MGEVRRAETEQKQTNKNVLKKKQQNRKKRQREYGVTEQASIKGCNVFELTLT